MNAAMSDTPQKLNYPKTATVDHIDTYFGTAVPDPYRWLEDDRSEATAAWVKAQNAVTFDFLAQIPYREPIKQRLLEIMDYPRYSAPEKRGDRFFFLQE